MFGKRKEKERVSGSVEVIPRRSKRIASRQAGQPDGSNENDVNEKLEVSIESADEEGVSHSIVDMILTFFG